MTEPRITGDGLTAAQADEVLALQENLLRSHAVGMGPLMTLGESRLALALRIQALGKGYSGVTGLLGLLSVFGLIVLLLIPDRRRTVV